MLINVKMPTIVGILTLVSMIKGTSESLKARKVIIFQFADARSVIFSCCESERCSATFLTWVKVLRIIPEFTILRLTFHGSQPQNLGILKVIIAFLI